MNTFIFPDKDFNLKHTFDCGQCFRWEEENGSFAGVAGGFWGKFTPKENGIELVTTSPDESFWIKYLDLKRDYSAIKKQLAINPLMEEAVNYGGGIRILKQEFFETLISFIISQRSSIPKIKGCIKKICEKWGDEIHIENNVYYTFPTPKQLENASEADFRILGVGYRAPYLERCVKMVLTGEIDENSLLEMDTPSAREKVLSIYGVGDKVCDCVMLFALAKYDLFPSDVWIKRVMCESFGSSDKTAKKDGEKLFGSLSGFAQQYLFYYRRNMKF